MKRVLARTAAAIAVAGLLIAGCAQPAPAPTPTKAPAAPAPTKAAEPTKPAAATAAPTKAPEPTKPAAAPAKIDFPQKGKSISVIVPWPPAGSIDILARVTSPMLEKELGIPVQVVDRPGGGGQVGTAELALAKPDGYSIGYTILPSTVALSLDPARKSTFGRNSFAPIYTYTEQSVIVSVQTNSPYKTLKDLVDAAKANPEKIKAGGTGILGPAHLGLLALQKEAGINFAVVHFDGAAPQITALMGGHLDASFTVGVLPQIKTGELRVLGLAAKQESKFIPGVKTFEAQGYKVYFGSTNVVSAPAGTPKEIIDILAAAFKKVVASSEHKAKMEELAYDPVDLGPEQSAAFWSNQEAQIGPIILEQAQKR